MRYLIIILLCFPLLAAASEEADHPENEIEFERVLSGHHTESELKVLLSRETGKHLGFFLFAEGSQEEQRAYFGPTYSPNSHVRIGLGVGVARGHQKYGLRNGGFFEFEGRRYEVFFLAEDGYGDPFWVGRAMWRETRRWGIGVMGRRGLGFGPRVDYTFFGTHITLWTAGLRNSHDTSLLAGLGLGF